MCRALPQFQGEEGAPLILAHGPSKMLDQYSWESWKIQGQDCVARGDKNTRNKTNTKWRFRPQNTNMRRKNTDLRSFMIFYKNCQGGMEPNISEPLSLHDAPLRKPTSGVVWILTWPWVGYDGYLFWKKKTVFEVVACGVWKV